MNPVIAPISKNNNVEQQLDSPEFPTIGKNATQFSNSPSRIHIEPQKIHIDKDLDNRRSSIICGIKEINLVYKNNRDDANEIKCEKQNRQLFSKNEKTNTINTSGNKKNIVNDFVKNSQLRKTSREPDVDVIIYQLVIKENKPSNELTRNKSSYIKNINNRDTNNILGKTSDYKGDTQNAIFKWNNIDGSFGPQNQNVSGTNNLRNVSGNKQIFINGHVTTEASFDQKEFFRAQGKEQEQYPAIPLDNQTEFNENKNIDYDNSDAGTYNIGNIKNTITNTICSEIYKPSGFVSLSGTKSHINGEANILCTITNIKKLRFCVVLELCIGYISSDKNAGNCNSQTKQIRLKVPKTYVRDKKQTLALEIKLGHCDRRAALHSFNRPENIAASTIGRDAYLSIVIGVPSDVRYIVLNIPEDPQYEIDIESATLQVLKNTEREIMFDIRSDNLLQNKKIINKEDPISLNNYEAPKFDIKNDMASSNEKIINKEDIISRNNYENSKSGSINDGIFPNEKVIDKGNSILTSKNEDLKFDISGNEEFSNKKMVNKEDFLSLNNYESPKLGAKNNNAFSDENMVKDFVSPKNDESLKLDIKNNESLSNEKKIDEENFASPNNYENSKFGIKNNLAFSNVEETNKENFISQNNYENPRFDIQDNDAFLNKNITNNGNPISLDNYGNTKFDIRIRGTFSDEKMINNEYSVPSNSDNGNKKLVIKCSKVFLNEEINSKEHSVASNDAERAENRNHESEPSIGILGRVAGFFGQIMGMCRRKK